MKYRFFGFLFCLLITQTTLSQSKRMNGPLIMEFGPTFNVEHPDIKTDTTSQFKVIFDVSQSAEERTTVNKYIETAARFLNMHTNAGMEVDQLNVAMTIHGGAWQDILTDDAYKQRYGHKNPNTALIDALVKSGVDIILCGQTAGARKLSSDDINPNVNMALSAMTALLQYQNNGYKFIKF